MVNYYSKYLKYKNKYLQLKNDLEKEKLNEQKGGATEKTDVMLFKAEWCGHCKQFSPVWKEMEQKYSKKYNFISYDSDKDKQELDEDKDELKQEIYGTDNLISTIIDKFKELVN